VNAAERIAEFQRAVARLGQALTLAGGNPLGVDASIQRFEFCMELAWKALREVLMRDHGIDSASPKTTLQGAYRLGLIDDEAAWLAMWRDRNLSSHTYREALAQEIFSRLPAYFATLSGLAAALGA
jgi:nucleotidyltransferase substrate binding protein (TIGR01987 family)